MVASRPPAFWAEKCSSPLANASAKTLHIAAVRWEPSAPEPASAALTEGDVPFAQLSVPTC